MPSQQGKSVATFFPSQRQTPLTMVDRDPPTIPHNLNLSPTQLRKLHRYLSHVVGFPITLRQTSNFMDVRQGYEQHWKTYKEEYASGLGRRRIRCFEKDDFPILESYMRRAYPPKSKILLWHRRIHEVVSWWLQLEESAGGGDHDLCRHDGSTIYCHGDREGCFF